MKKIVFLFIVGFTLQLQAQVGIGQTNPQADLHIGGDFLVQEEIKLRSLSTVTSTEENFKLLTRTTNSTPVGEIKVLNVDDLNVAPINTVDYHFTNLSSDNLTDVDLQYDTSQYIVAVANFRYVGDAIKKVVVGSDTSIGHFVVNAFESGGTWHLEIRNRDLDLNVGDSVEYFVTMVVYDKSYFRNLPAIITDLGGSNTGTASSTPILH